METSGRDSVSPVAFYSFATTTFTFIMLAFVAIQLDTAWLTTLLFVFSLFVHLGYTWMFFRVSQSSRYARPPSAQP